MILQSNDYRISCTACLANEGEFIIFTQKSFQQKELENQISETRKKMIELGMSKGFTARETIDMSQKLDILLNQYRTFM